MAEKQGVWENVILLQRNKILEFSEGRMKYIWILGAGRYGLKAAKALPRKYEKVELTIIEKDSGICHGIEKLGFKAVCMDGIEYLLQNLKSMDHPDWIIPAIPVHVAYEWVRLKIKGRYILKTIPPSSMYPLTSLPNVFEGKRGEIYMSIADFICPDHCPEPKDICTHTVKPRPFTLYKRLESIQDDHFRSVVVQSRQLFPGVGGYTPKALFQTLDIIKSSRIPVLLSTACRCHGVMHAFKLKKE